MPEIKVNTAEIPSHVCDELCSTLLSSIKSYIAKNPRAAEELQRRGEEFYRRKAERIAKEAAQAVV